MFPVYRSLTVSVNPPGAALGQLVGGRISVSILALSYFASAITIAVRYSAVRRQFGPGDKEELSVIEYQLQVSKKLAILLEKVVMVFKISGSLLLITFYLV